MTRKAVIQQALSIVREIEEEVKTCCFPAWDVDTLTQRPDMNARFRECVRNVVAVYCAHTREELMPEMNGLLAAMQLNRTGPP